MTIRAEIDAVELKRITRRLEALEPKLRKKVLRRATREAMRPVLAAAKAEAPVGKPDPNNPDYRPGALKKSIKLRALKKSRKARVGVLVGADKAWYKGDQFYAAFLEFGWKVGKRGTANRREIPGRHFLENAYRIQGDAVLRNFVEEIPRQIDRLIREL